MPKEALVGGTGGLLARLEATGRRQVFAMTLWAKILGFGGVIRPVLPDFSHVLVVHLHAVVSQDLLQLARSPLARSGASEVDEADWVARFQLLRLSSVFSDIIAKSIWI